MAAPFSDRSHENSLLWKRQIGRDAQPRARRAGRQQRGEERVVAVGRLDEDLGLALPARTQLELDEFSFPDLSALSAGSRRTRSAGPRGPRPSGRATMEEGPTSGTTLKPSRCAASTSAAPGSAIAGQPASESRPRGRFSRRGCSSPRTSSSMVLMLSSRTGMPSAPRKARALFAFSTTKSFSPLTVRSAGPGNDCSGDAPSGVGMA